MLHRPSPLQRLLSAVAFLAVAGAGDSARAQVVEKAARPVDARRNNEMQLDSFVFSNLGAGSAVATRSLFESQLTLHVEELDRSVELLPPQKKKLLLAGRGDIKRYFDRIEEVRQKYLSDPKFQFNAQMQQVWKDLQPVYNVYQNGLFSNGSLFAKTMHATLTPDQVKQAEELSRERMLYRYWARVELVLELLNYEVGFTDDQRARVLELLRSETRPPRKMGNALYDYYLVLYQIGRIPEEKLRPVFEDYQWPLVERYLQGGQMIARNANRMGFELDEPDRPKASATKPAIPRPEAKK